MDVFVDGQNFYHRVKDLFGHRTPNFDIQLVAEHFVRKAGAGYELGTIHFYTGFPSPIEAPVWNRFWQDKLDHMKTLNGGKVSIYAPLLRYRTRLIDMGNGRVEAQRSPYEKGIDVRIAIDMVRAAFSGRCEGMLLLSQDSDLEEAFREARDVALEFKRPLRLFCGYPTGENDTIRRGVRGGEWLTIEAADYEQCIDPTHTYRRAQLLVEEEVADMHRRHQLERAKRACDLVRGELHGHIEPAVAAP